MSDHGQEISGPDFGAGIELSTLAENQPLLGHFDGESVVLVRKGDEVFATGAVCTHYSGPLAEGIVVGETIHCPWHHARFSLRTGEATGAPALNPVACFEVRKQSGLAQITGKKTVDYRVPCPRDPSPVVIVGAGGAGAACADMLRAKGYAGPITLAGEEEPGPVDRPNLSKDYLAGNAPEEWVPLRTREYYESIHAELITGDPAVRIDPGKREVSLQSGRTLEYGSLLLATGGEPRSLPIDGAKLPHVHLLRSLADSRAIVAKAQDVKTCAVIGSGFIGLEVAASLRQRGLEVTVIGNESVPLGRIVGEEVGGFIQKLHEEHGVHFRMNTTAKAIRADRVELSDGSSVDAGLVVIGVGVSPRTSLAEAAGLGVKNGILVDETMRSGVSDIFAAGDVARYPELISGEPVRIEHWVVAERQGQAAARSMLGIGEAFREAPFFWSQHYDVAIAYVGYASSWDSCEIKGSLEKRDACVVYRHAGKALAVATIGRDQVSLKVEAAFEAGDAAALEAILREQ